MNNINITAAVIFGTAIFQGILCTLFFLFNKKGSKIANRCMLAMIVSITLIIFQNFIIFNGSYVRFPDLIFLFSSLEGLIAPLFFMYVFFLVNPDRKWKWYYLFHLTLFCVLFYRNWWGISMTNEDKIATVNYFYYQDTLFKGNVLFELILYKLVDLGYGLASWYLIKNKIADLKRWTSNTNIQYLDRFKLIVYLFNGYVVLFIFLFIYPFFDDVTTGLYEVLIHVLNSVIIGALSLVTMQQPDRLVFLLTSVSQAKQQSQSNDLLFQNLEEVMDTQKPFLNSDLKLNELAKLLDAPAYLLSDHINKNLSINFYEFVNQYRVEEFKKRVSSDQFEKYTLLSIALDVGFNSKASFNRIFKHHTQMTPSQYRNLNRNTN